MPLLPSKGSYYKGGSQEIAPAPKQVSAHVGSVFEAQINPSSLVVVSGPGDLPNTLAGNAPEECGPDGQSHQLVIGYSTAAQTDSYGLPIAGGPQPSDLTRKVDTQPGNSLILGQIQPKTAQQPFVSKKMKASHGVKLVPYGDYTIGGVTPGTPDPVVTAPDIETKLAQVSGSPKSGLVNVAGDDGDSLAANPDNVTIQINGSNQLVAVGGGGGGGGSGGGEAANSCQVVLNAVHAIAAGGSWIVSWDAATTNTGTPAIWDATHPTRLTAPLTGLYRFDMIAPVGTATPLGEDDAFDVLVMPALNGAGASTESAGGPLRGLASSISFSAAIPTTPTPEPTSPQLVSSAIVSLNAGDYFELQIDYSITGPDSPNLLVGADTSSTGGTHASLSYLGNGSDAAAGIVASRGITLIFEASSDADRGIISTVGPPPGGKDVAWNVVMWTVPDADSVWVGGTTTPPYSKVYIPVSGFYQVDLMTNFILVKGGAADFSATVDVQLNNYRAGGRLNEDYVQSCSGTWSTEGRFSASLGHLMWCEAGGWINVQTAYVPALVAGQEIVMNWAVEDCRLSVYLVRPQEAEPNFYPWFT